MRHLIFFTVCIFILSCQTQNPVPSSKLGSADEWFTSARLGDIKTLKSMQESSGRPWDYTSENGQTALMFAARFAQIDLINFLLDQKVKINRLDKAGFHSLSYALHGPSKVDAVGRTCEALVARGADPFLEDYQKLSPILLMIEFGLLKCIQLVRFTTMRTCDQADRLTEVSSLVKYAEVEEEIEIRDYLKSQGCP